MRKAFLIVAVSFLLSGCMADPVVDAPEFDLELISGGRLSSQELRGKVVVLDFWATWCPPCIEEIPNYNALAAKMEGQDVEIIGVTIESGVLDDVRTQVTEFGIEYPVVMGDDAVVQGFGGVYAFPTTFVLDRDWKIQKKYLGVPPGKEEELEELITLLLEEPAASPAIEDSSQLE